jgi:hypothetical protein
MARQIGALLLATIAAPYLGALSLLISTILSQGTMWEIHALKEIPEFIGLIFLVGTFGVALYGLPVLLAASVTAFFITRLRVRSPVLIIGAGSLMGFGFGIYINRRNYWTFVPGLALSGAICGWIYWRIAITQTPNAPRAIDPACSVGSS